MTKDDLEGHPQDHKGKQAPVFEHSDPRSRSRKDISERASQQETQGFHHRHHNQSQDQRQTAEAGARNFVSAGNPRNVLFLGCTSRLWGGALSGG